MLRECFRELYSGLLRDFDNILSSQHVLNLWEDYGLRSNEEIVDYLTSRLLDTYRTLDDAKIAASSDSAVSELLSRVTCHVSCVHETLQVVFNAVNQVNNNVARHLRLNIFELDYTVRDILAPLYKILEELVLFLYTDGSDTQRTTELYPTLENAISEIAHIITVLQSASSRKIAHDISNEIEAKLLRENVLEADEGFEEDPGIKEKDEEKKERNRIQRSCINGAAIIGARRAAYMLACCIMLCTQAPSKDDEIGNLCHTAKVRSDILSLTRVSMLLAENVPTRFRVIVSEITSKKFFSATQKLLDTIKRELTEEDIARNTLLKSIESVVISAYEAFNTAAHSYAAHAEDKPIYALSWIARKPFEHSFVILNLAEALFLTHHMHHMAETTLQEALEKMQQIQEKHGKWARHSLMMRAVTTASYDAVNSVRKAESDLQSALSLFCHMGGGNFAEKFLYISQSSNEDLQPNGLDACIHSYMHEVAQYIRSACFELNSLEKYVYGLKIHKSRMMRYIHSVYLCCTRFFDTLFHEHSHDYAWNSSCKSTLPVLPGELPNNVDACELLHNAPNVLFSSSMLDEALNMAIFERLSVHRYVNVGAPFQALHIAHLEERASSSFLSPINSAIQFIKGWYADPSSLLSHISLTNLSQGIQECAIRMLPTGVRTLVTNAVVSKETLGERGEGKSCKQQ